MPPSRTLVSSNNNVIEKTGKFDGISEGSNGCASTNNNNKGIMCEWSLAPADGGDKTKDDVSNRMKIKRVLFSSFRSFGLPTKRERARISRDERAMEQIVKTIRRIYRAGAATCRWMSFSSCTLTFLAERQVAQTTRGCCYPSCVYIQFNFSFTHRQWMFYYYLSYRLYSLRTITDPHASHICTQHTQL